MTITNDILTPTDLLDPAVVAHLDDDTSAHDPVVVVNLDHLEALTPDQIRKTRAGHFTFRRIPVGVRTRPLSLLDVGPGQLLLERMATTLVPADDRRSPEQGTAGRFSADVSTVRVADPVAVVESIRRNAAANASAALAFDTLLRINAKSTVREGLLAESFARAMLLAGGDYRRWLRSLPDSDPARQATGPARLERQGSVVEIRLPATTGQSGLDRSARLQLAGSLRGLGPGVSRIRLSGDGSDFWGVIHADDVLTPEEIAAAHISRMADNLGAALYPHRHEMTAQIRGRCVGMGLELAALAHNVSATADAVFQLPQLRMGLVPAAGGTVSLTRRIGRWRTAYLALSAATIDAQTAYRWRLVDELTDARPTR